MRKELSIGLVIPTLNRYTSLSNLIIALTKQTMSPQSIYIINSGDTDALKKKLCDNYKPTKTNVKIVNSPYKNLPFQRYLGYLVCSEDIVVFLDDDIIISDLKFLDKLVAPLKDSSFIASTCNIIFEKPEPQDNTLISSRWTNNKSSKLQNFFNKLTGYSSLKDGECNSVGIRKYPMNRTSTTKISFLHGGCMAFTKSYLRNDHFSDDLFSLYHVGLGKGEDFFLSRQISLEGKMCLVGKAIASHIFERPIAYSMNPYNLGKAVAYSRFFLSKTWRGQSHSRVLDMIFYWYYGTIRLLSGLIMQIFRPDKNQFNYLLGWLSGMFLSIIRPQKSAVLCPHIKWHEEAQQIINNIIRIN